MASPPPVQGGGRNVLVITLDQWRADCLSALGHPSVRTPNLDALAADGVLFANHFGQATPCGPARASLWTGLYLMTHRSVRNGTPLDRRHTNLALELRKAGYAPALFGYTDTSADPRGLPPGDPLLTTYEGVLPGFDPVCLMTDSVEPWAEHLRARGYTVPAQTRRIYEPAAPGGPAVYRAEDSDTAYLADRLIAWLGGRGGRRWFAHASFIRPHPPWVAPEPYHGRADAARAPAPARAASAEDEARQHPFLACLLRALPGQGWLPGRPIVPQDLGEAEVRAIRAIYYALIEEADHQVGRIIAALKASGEYDRTLIVVTSDHGEMLGDHWLFGKAGYFDAAFHVPLLVRDPAGSARGAVVDAFSEHVDLMPTVLDRLGLKVPAACDGMSLGPFLDGATPASWRDAVHWEHDFRDVAAQALGLPSDACSLAVLRGRRWKYVHFAALPPLLFDLQTDPGETRSLAGDPAAAPILATCAADLLSLRMRHADRALSNLSLGPDGVTGDGASA